MKHSKQKKGAARFSKKPHHKTGKSAAPGRRRVEKPVIAEPDTKETEIAFESEAGKIGKKLYRFLQKTQQKGVSIDDICAYMQKKEYPPKETKYALRVLRQEGRAVISRGKYYPAARFGMQPGVVSRIKESYGYAALTDSEQEVFIPGKYLCGCLPGERVLLSRCRNDYRFDSGDRYQVEDVLVAQEDYTFVGTVKRENGSYYVYPDRGMDFGIRLRERGGVDCKAGDKISAVIVSRGDRHIDLRAEAVQNYGDAQRASVCAEAVLDDLGIVKEFPETVLYEAKQLQKHPISEKELLHREDWRFEPVFTIDAASSKDLDDAISLRCYPDHYQLGVHIADVSHYVKYHSAIDQEAYARGTSVYYADQVIPMLPRELSNGICSLNPNEDRLTFSAILTIGLDGRLEDFDFRKTVIRSRVKGVYSEVNAILDGTASPELLQKYDGLIDTLQQMQKLASILTANRRERGAPEIDKAEGKIVIGEDGRTQEIVCRERGVSEQMIEEFMLTANEAAAKAAKLKELPFVYRIHEPPTPEKVNSLAEAAAQLGFSTVGIEPGMPVKRMAELLRAAEDTPAHDVLHTIALRSMSKARYSETPVGHYGLALEDYAHFTSPIRRYPDLTIHRILTEFLPPAQKSPEQLQRKYQKFVKDSALQSSETELRAMNAERRCSDCYKAEYMKDHVGEQFEGVVSSVASYGIYVALPNTVEGLIHHSRLPGNGEYQMLNAFLMKNMQTGKEYRIGDCILVRCSAVDVSAGKVDFEAIEPDAE